MHILLTGSTGYIGKRLLPELIEAGHKVTCCVRDAKRFNPSTDVKEVVDVLEIDLLDPESLKNIPKDIDAGYYLVHSMSSSADYAAMELECAKNFCEAFSQTQAKQLIYLSGIVNQEKLSEHLQSRKRVEDELSKGSYALTTLRAGIIVGSGSASFEIIRDLVEKLPIMVAPRWLETKTQPIGISDVLLFLTGCLAHEQTYGNHYDIGCDDVLTYKEMLMGFAEVRGLQRRIYTVPVMTPKLSSYWLYFVTSTSYLLARSLVDSMKIEVVCRPNNLRKILGIEPISYNAALVRAMNKVNKDEIASSWKDSYTSSGTDINIEKYGSVPSFGCFKDVRRSVFRDRETCIHRIWSIGGKNGWYYGNWLWQIRGFLDKLWGGVGLRRGRTNQDSISVGDALDFWRVMEVDKEQGRLLLFAEMKLPGEAWLEFSVQGDELIQTATFRPLGLSGRLYWYAVVPFHAFIFNGLIIKLTE
jgi:uncharacterized protein YbjT (DUF2867 family)